MLFSLVQTLWNQLQKAFSFKLPASKTSKFWCDRLKKYKYRPLLVISLCLVKISIFLQFLSFTVFPSLEYFTLFIDSAIIQINILSSYLPWSFIAIIYKGTRRKQAILTVNNTQIHATHIRTTFVLQLTLSIGLILDWSNELFLLPHCQLVQSHTRWQQRLVRGKQQRGSRD